MSSLPSVFSIALTSPSGVVASEYAGAISILCFTVPTAGAINFSYFANSVLAAEVINTGAVTFLPNDITSAFLLLSSPIVVGVAPYNKPIPTPGTPGTTVGCTRVVSTLPTFLGVISTFLGVSVSGISNRIAFSAKYCCLKMPLGLPTSASYTSRNLLNGTSLGLIFSFCSLSFAFISACMNFRRYCGDKAGKCSRTNLRSELVNCDGI